MRMLCAAAIAAVSVIAVPAQAAAVLKANYLFQNSLQSTVDGAPALTLVDPFATSLFRTESVFGEDRTVLHLNGTASKGFQAGLKFNTAGLLTDNSYSVAMTIKFYDRNNNWRRILDTSNGTADAGFYVNPQNNLAVFPQAGSNAGFTNGMFRNVVLTVGPAGPGNVRGYIDGGASFSATTDVVNIRANDLINLFLDDGSEWSRASIAALSFYDGVLTQDQVTAINGDPYAAGAVPEPASWAMMVAGFGLIGAGARRKRAVKTVSA